MREWRRLLSLSILIMLVPAASAWENCYIGRSGEHWCISGPDTTNPPPSASVPPTTAPPKSLNPDDVALEPGADNGKCDPQIGENCRNTNECTCLPGQTCDPQDGKAQPGGCVSAFDSVKCPEGYSQYGTQCVKKEGTASCKIVTECPGKGEAYCEGNKVYKYSCWSASIGCQRQTVKECGAAEACIGDRCMAKQGGEGNGNPPCQTSEDCPGKGSRSCNENHVIYWYCTSAGCLRQDAIDCAAAGKRCSDGQCVQASNGCEVDGMCGPRDYCTNCPSCDCHGLQCSPGAEGADEHGCFDQCIPVPNSYYDSSSGKCACKSGFKSARDGVNCVLNEPREGYAGTYGGHPMEVRKDGQSGRLYLHFLNGDRYYLDGAGEISEYSNDRLALLRSQADGVSADWRGYAKPAPKSQEGPSGASESGGSKLQSDAAQLTALTHDAKSKSRRTGFQKADDPPIMTYVGRWELSPPDSNVKSRLELAASEGVDRAEAGKLEAAAAASDAAAKLRSGQVDENLVYVAVDYSLDAVENVKAPGPKTSPVALGEEDGDTLYREYYDKATNAPNPVRRDLVDFDGGDSFLFSDMNSIPNDFLYQYSSWYKPDDPGNGPHSFVFEDSELNKVKIPPPGVNAKWRREATADGRVRFVPWDLDRDEPIGDVAVYVEDRRSFFKSDNVYLASRKKPDLKYNLGEVYDL